MENLPYPMSAPPVVNYKAIKEKNVPPFQLDFFFFFFLAPAFLAYMPLSARLSNPLILHSSSMYRYL